MGLGSSASFAASFAASLYTYLANFCKIEIKDFKEKINNFTFEMEKIFHEYPSGNK
jgi:mevalonate kinase